MARTWKILPAILLLSIVVFCALYRGLVVRHYAIETDKLPAGAKLRLVLLTDLHSALYGESQRKLLHTIAAQSPDAVLLGGDIVDDIDPQAPAEALFAGLRDMGAPAYYVSGNHELWGEDYTAVRAMIKGYGVTVLEGETVPLPAGDGTVLLSGIGDPLEYGDYAGALSDAFSALDGDAFNILLAHRPEFAGLYAAYPFDLALAGHAHGGQVRIPLLSNGLFAPSQGWFPKYVGGQYAVGNTALIVGRGLSYNPRLPRVFNPPEIVVIDIVGTGETIAAPQI